MKKYFFSSFTPPPRDHVGVPARLPMHIYSNYEHSEQARAPHTNGPRDVPRCGALSLLQKDAALQGGVMVVLRPLFAAAIVRGGARCVSQVLHRCAQAVSRGASRCASQVNDRGAHADARGATHVLNRDIQAVSRGAARCALHVPN